METGMTFPISTILKILLVEFIKTPTKTLADIIVRLLPDKGPSSQVPLLREIVRKNPLILQIETTNVCNAKCVFCAYPNMQRKRGVMAPAMFAQIIDEYAAMGGGPVSLTPLVGDALIDPHFMGRLGVLSDSPRISQISMTTNGIAFERYSDEEIQRILTVCDCIQISVGGLDAQTYRVLYGVDKFPKVLEAVSRVLKLRKAVADPSHINLAFRTNDWLFELRFRRQLEEFRRHGAYVSHIWTYANYSGLVQSDKSLKMEVIAGTMEKCQQCVYAAIHMAIGWDGRITACGCVDFEGRDLRIGQVGEESLSEVWSGEKRRAILNAFASGKLPQICRDCSAYQPDSVMFASSFFRGVEPHRPLAPEFFQKFWGG
jgi:radical SAM protein with 4Fe4S-binding SPASM domain